jgi:ubiquinone/menaquinone biosynthesis C-methylase UbiE
MLIIGAGKSQRRRGAVHIDIHPFPGIDIVHDLNKVPWPINDNTHEHISCIHVVEHLRDLVSFMNEAHRVLTKGGTMYLETPEAGSDFDLTHSDPTHVRCYRVYSFINYFTPEGIAKFGYTDKAWAFYKCLAEDGVLKVHCSPVK